MTGAVDGMKGFLLGQLTEMAHSVSQLLDRLVTGALCGTLKAEHVWVSAGSVPHNKKGPANLSPVSPQIIRAVLMMHYPSFSACIPLKLLFISSYRLFLQYLIYCN